MRLPCRASAMPKPFPFFIVLLMASQLAFAAVTDSRLFGYAEANYPSLFGGTPTAGQVTYQGQEYTYRYYPASNNYLAIDASGLISILGNETAGELVVVGAVSAFEPIITAWEASPAGTLAGSATSYQSAYDTCYNGTPLLYTSTYCGAYANAIVAGNTPTVANQAGAAAAGSNVGNIGMGETITATGTPYSSSSGSTTSYQSAYDTCYNGTPLLYTSTYCAAYANAIVAGSAPAAANQAGAAAAGSNVGNIGMGETITATGTPYSSGNGGTSAPASGSFPSNYGDRSATPTGFDCPGTAATSTVTASEDQSVTYSVIEGACTAADMAWYQIDACRTASASTTIQADIAHTVCWANNSLDPYRTRYVDRANYLASQYGLRQPTYSFLPDFYFAAGATSGGTDTSGTGTGTSSGEDACSSQPYVDGADDPQVDTFCQIAQFDACMYSATGNTAYVTDMNSKCTVLNGFLPYLSTTWSCRYCP